MYRISNFEIVIFPLKAIETKAPFNGGFAFG